MNDERHAVMQQPIRKWVGRRRTPAEDLAAVEDLAEFAKKHAHAALAAREEEYFPIRKAVDRPRRGGN